MRKILSSSLMFYLKNKLIDFPTKTAQVDSRMIHSESGLWIRINFFADPAVFLNADPDQAALKMRIRIQL